VEGEPGARVGGWIFYGLDLAFIPVTTFFSLFYMEDPPPHGWMTLLGLGGALSQSLFAADAFIAHRQAKALEKGTALSESSPAAAISPLMAPFAAPTPDGGAVFGLAGAF